MRWDSSTLNLCITANDITVTIRNLESIQLNFVHLILSQQIFSMRRLDDVEFYWNIIVGAPIWFIFDRLQFERNDSKKWDGHMISQLE